MVKDEQRQKHHRIAGYALMASVVVLILLVSFIADIKRLFDRRYTAYAVFQTAPALTRGAAVWIAGREVGAVTRIGFLPVRGDTTARLAVELDLPWKERELIRLDSKVKLASARLISEPVIDIAPGTAASPILQPGDTLYAEPVYAPGELMAAFRELWTSLDSLLAGVEHISPMVERRQGQFAEIGRNMNAVRAEFAALNHGFATGTMSIMSNRSELGMALDHMSTTAARIGPALQHATARYQDPALRTALARVQLRAQALSAQIAQLRELAANSSLTRLQADSAIVKALHRAQTELDSLMAETKRNPLRFWF